MSHPDWKTERDRVDLGQVATGLLGPAPGRRGEHGRRLWWPCPFHDDKNPSFFIDPGKPNWRCYGCGEHGDAANLVMKLERLTFPEAVAKLLDGPFGATTYRPTPSRPPGPKPPEPPKGLPLVEALALVEAAAAQLWTDEGIEAREYLIRDRHLTAETIRAARLGWTSFVEIPTKEGKQFGVSGIVIPWFDGDRLSMVNIRRPDGSRPKYAQAFRDRVSTFPVTSLATIGQPLIVTEGEFDALLLGQELAGLATVVTLGSASGRPEVDLLGRFLKASPWFIATDDDSAGKQAAQKWPVRARRVLPPGAFKDWTEAAQGGVNLRRWWTDRLAGAESPELFTWSELAEQRWGDADQADVGIEILGTLDELLDKHRTTEEDDIHDGGDSATLKEAS